MRAGFATIEGNLVHVEDGRISEFPDAIEREQSMLELRTARLGPTNQALKHRVKLDVINEQWGSQFIDNDSPTSSVADQVAEICVSKPTPRALRFISSYGYFRGVKILSTDFGPDYSPVFGILHKAADGVVKDMVTQAVDEGDSSVMGFGFSHNYMGRIFEQVNDKNSSLQEELLEQFAQQRKALDIIGERVLLNVAQDAEVSDPSEEDAFTDTEEPSGGVGSELLESVDVAMIRLCTALEYMDADFIYNLDSAVLAQILGVGRYVLQQRGLTRSRNDNPLTLTGEMDIEKALCHPSRKLIASPDIFFPGRGQSTKEAKQYCHNCPMEDDCLSFSLANHLNFGIWGGTSERERRRIRKELNGDA